MQLNGIGKSNNAIYADVNADVIDH